MAIIPPEIETILKKQKLTEVKNVSSHYHNYASICMDRKKDLVYLKVRLYPKLVSHTSFIKEVLLTKFLSDNFYGNKFFVTPKYYKSELVKKPEWMLRGYTNGNRMGDVWGFSPEFVSCMRPKKIADILDFVRGDISDKFRDQKKDFNFRLFEKHNAAKYKAYFTNYLHLAKKFIKAKEQKKALAIFDKYGKFLVEHNNYLAHGDLHPGNFVYNKGKIVVHDWKYSHLDNPCIDLAFMWFLLWLNEEWREELLILELKRAKNKEVFFKCFFLSIIKLAPKMISILVQASNISKSDRRKGVNKIVTSLNQSIKFLSDIE